MATTPLVSVIMPVYNGMPYLPQAVQSIFAQTLDDWELIVLDDGCTDSSWNYVRRIRDSRVRIARNPGRLGVAESMNRAIAMARGKYIARMDADDISLRRRLEQQVALLESRTDLSIVGCGTIKTTANLEIISVRRPPTSHREITRLIRSGQSFLFGPDFALTEGASMGRAEWLRRWPLDSSIPYAAEFDGLCRSFRESVFGNVPQALYIYRRGGNTGSWWRQVRACWYRSESILKYCFYPGNYAQATMALASLALRPFTAAAIYALASLSGPSGSLLAGHASGEDCALLAQALKELKAVEVPLSDEL